MDRQFILSLIEEHKTIIAMMSKRLEQLKKIVDLEKSTQISESSMPQEKESLSIKHEIEQRKNEIMAQAAEIRRNAMEQVRGVSSMMPSFGMPKLMPGIMPVGGGATGISSKGLGNKEKKKNE